MYTDERHDSLYVFFNSWLCEAVSICAQSVVNLIHPEHLTDGERPLSPCSQRRLFTTP
jgi:hypothetical protein